MRSNISIPHPQASPVKLLIELGACKLTLSKGLSADFISGYYNDPTDERPFVAETNGSTVRIWQKQLFAISGRHYNHPEFVLEISDSVPFELELKSGASEVFVDLGGLPVEKATVRFNAGKMTLDFSKPNPTEMKFIDFSANAGDMILTNLANSNADKVSVEGSAAGFKLNFAGNLTKDMSADISSSVSGVRIELPKGINARVKANAMLGGVSGIDSSWLKNTGEVWTSGEGRADLPMLAIDAKVTLGGLEFRTV
jgi:hypothetical protein